MMLLVRPLPEAVKLTPPEAVPYVPDNELERVTALIVGLIAKSDQAVALVDAAETRTPSKAPPALLALRLCQ